MKKFSTFVAACGAVALLSGVGALPARADDDGWRGRGHEQREREWRNEHERREWCEQHRRECAHPPTVVYETGPPPVVIAPAPVYVAPPPPAVVYQPAPVVAPSPGIELVVPLRIGH